MKFFSNVALIALITFGQIACGSYSEQKINAYINTNSRVEPTIVNRWGLPVKAFLIAGIGTFAVTSLSFMGSSSYSLNGFKDYCRDFIAPTATKLGLISAWVSFAREANIPTDKRYVEIAENTLKKLSEKDFTTAASIKVAAQRTCLISKTLKHIASRSDKKVLDVSGLQAKTDIMKRYFAQTVIQVNCYAVHKLAKNKQDMNDRLRE